MTSKARLVALASAMSLPVLAMASGLRLRRAECPLADGWRHADIESRRLTQLGTSFRPRQVEAFGLDAKATLQQLLGYPFQVLRLGAYWDRMEPASGTFRPDDLDWQVEAAERAGKKIILCLGAVKTFGYPEFFVPRHHLPNPLAEGTLINPDTHPDLLAAALSFVTRVTERYRDRKAVIAWQVEHEAVDPLGMEHSWRLGARFVAQEVDAVRRADPTRPVMMSGFLPTSPAVALQQWWRTRDQGDSLSVAGGLADIVGIDYYPRHALVSAGPLTLYLEGTGDSTLKRRQRGLRTSAHKRGQQLMISEGQAEPWESTTRPPSPAGRAMSSCTPDAMIGNYNRCMSWARSSGIQLNAYLFWGAEYWVLRDRGGDQSYLRAITRILDNA